MTYTIPCIPPSMNKYKGRSNVWEYRRDKDEWEQRVSAYCRPRPQKPIARCVLTITYYFPTRIRHDPNNYDGQFLTDGLVKAGIITDDSFDVLDLVLRGDYDKKHPRTVIDILQIPAEEGGRK